MINGKGLLYFLTFILFFIFLYALKVLGKKNFLLLSFFYSLVFAIHMFLDNHYTFYVSLIMLLVYEYKLLTNRFNHWLISAIIIQAQLVFSLILWILSLDIFSYFCCDGKLDMEISLMKALLIAVLYAVILLLLYKKIKKTDYVKRGFYDNKKRRFLACFTLVLSVILFTLHGISILRTNLTLYFSTTAGAIFLLWSTVQIFYLIEKNKADTLRLEGLVNKYIVDQKKLDFSRKFNHDYKSWLISLNELINQQRYVEAHYLLDNIIGYSDKLFIVNQYEQFQQLKNIAIQAIFHDFYKEVNEGNLKLKFDFQDISRISDFINIIDLIRMISILLNNAKEEVVSNRDTIQGEVYCQILNEEQSYFILVRNTTKEKMKITDIVKKGKTTKKGHSGLGLPILVDISNEYKNVSIEFQSESNEFQASIKIMK